MSEKKVKTDPLLKDDQNPRQSGLAQVAQPKVETKVAEPAKPVPPPTIPTKVGPGKDIIAETKTILDNSEHVNFIVPLAEGEAPGSFEEPQINGYKMKVPKGEMVNIPIQVANLLAEKYRIAMSAGKDKRIDRSSEVSDALN